VAVSTNVVFAVVEYSGKKYNVQSTERVIEEIVYLQKRFGVKEIAFYDDVFTLNHGRACDIGE